MAKIYIQQPGDKDGAVRPGEPLARPYVLLNDGKTMSFKAWLDAKRPN